MRDFAQSDLGRVPGRLADDDRARARLSARFAPAVGEWRPLGGSAVIAPRRRPVAPVCGCRRQWISSGEARPRVNAAARRSSRSRRSAGIRTPYRVADGPAYGAPSTGDGSGESVAKLLPKPCGFQRDNRSGGAALPVTISTGRQASPPARGAMPLGSVVECERGRCRGSGCHCLPALSAGRSPMDG